MTKTELLAELVDCSLAKKALIADNKRLTEELEAAKRQGAIEAIETALKDITEDMDNETIGQMLIFKLKALKAEADFYNPPKK